MHDLEQRADYRIGTLERRLFLMDTDDGTYWVRSDMTPEEAENVSDMLATWLHYARTGDSRGSYTAGRLYDDGERVLR